MPGCIQPLVFSSFWVKKKGVTQLSHSPYSPNLNSPDYYAFQRLKLDTKGTLHYEKSVTAKSKAFLVSKFKKAMDKLQYRANECICVNGDEFE